MFTSPNWVTVSDGGSGGGGGITTAEVNVIVDTKLKPTQDKVTALETSVASLATDVSNTITEVETVGSSLTALDTKVTKHAANKDNPHDTTPEKIGAALADHDHNGVYSSVTHDHDSVYSKTKHTHGYTDLTGVAAAIHDHDTVYSKLDHTHEVADITTLSDTLNEFTTHTLNQNNPHKTSVENIVHIERISFTDKQVTVPFTVTRATKEWALDENDKFVEYPENTLAYAFNRETNEYGAQLFNTRTRLNAYYKTPIFQFTNSVSKNISTVEDATAQAGNTVTRLHFNDTENTESSPTKDNNYSSTILLRNTDNVILAAQASKTFTLSVRIRHATADNPILKAVFECRPSFGTDTPIKEVLLTTEWQTVVATFTVTNSHETSEQTLQFGFHIEAEPTTRAWDMYYPPNTFVDVDWFQIEENSYATPLIMGAEGTQLTVSRTEAVYTGSMDFTNSKQVSVYAKSLKQYFNRRPWQVKKATGVSAFRYWGTITDTTKYTQRVENNTDLPNILDIHIMTLTTPATVTNINRDCSAFDFVENKMYGAANGISSDTFGTIVNVPWIDDDKQFILSSSGTSVAYLDGYLYELIMYDTLLDRQTMIDITA